MKCLVEGCTGKLVRYPMDLLMSPPIQQWQCVRCNSHYRKYAKDSIGGERLTLQNFNKDFDWRQMYMFLEDELSKLKGRKPRYLDDET